MKNSEVDFSQIILLREEKRLLRHIAAEGAITDPTNYAIYALMKFGLVRNTKTGDPRWDHYDRNVYVLTDRGRRYCEYIGLRQMTKRLISEYWRTIFVSAATTVLLHFLRGLLQG